MRHFILGVGRGGVFAFCFPISLLPSGNKCSAGPCIRGFSTNPPPIKPLNSISGQEFSVGCTFPSTRVSESKREKRILCHGMKRICLHVVLPERGAGSDRAGHHWGITPPQTPQRPHKLASIQWTPKHSNNATPLCKKINPTFCEAFAHINDTIHVEQIRLDLNIPLRYYFLQNAATFTSLPQHGDIRQRYPPSDFIYTYTHANCPPAITKIPTVLSTPLFRPVAVNARRVHSIF